MVSLKIFTKRQLKIYYSTNISADEPIKFSNEKIAESFISDGLKLAFSDKQIHGSEIEWLRETALKNSLEQNWFEKEHQKFLIESNLSVESDLKLYSII